MKNDVIEQFLSHYSNIRTKNSYRSQLNNYFKTMNVEPDKYLNNGRNYQQDIEKYWDTIIDKPPKTRQLAIVTVRMFLEENEIEFPKKYWKKLIRRAKGSKAVTDDKVPVPNEIKTILQHAKIQGKALFLMACSSGMRIDEIIQLKPEDIELKKEPVEIHIPGAITKTGDPRITFISNEAKESLLQWLNIRDKYLTSAVKRSTLGPKNSNDDRIFPFSYHNAREMWITMLKKAGFAQRDKTTDRYKYHIHTLRKFFRSRMPKAIGIDMTEFLMGHEGYLTREYRDYALEDLAKEYSKGMDLVTIFETTPDLTDINEKLKEKDEQMIQMQRTIEEMKAQITELRLEKLEKLNGLKRPSS